MTILPIQNQTHLCSDVKHITTKSAKPEQDSGSIFERIDDAIGLNALKRGIKKYSGLDYITDKISYAIDDGNDSNLSLGERLWEGVKGAGKAVENFVGSQGVAFMGVLALGSFLANKAKIGKAFNVVTKAYFLYEGVKQTYTGTRDFIKAETKEEAKEASITATTGGIMLYGTIKGIKKDIQNYKTKTEMAPSQSETAHLKQENAITNENKMGRKKYIKPELSQKSFAPQEDLCWNIKTHMAITEQAIKDYDGLSPTLKRYVARASELPDLDPKETVDFISPHFYDVLHEDPSFGTINDAENNAMSRFLSHTEKAKQHAEEGLLDSFLKEIGYAVHYLQDAATPPHTEHGNYIHKLYRVPMHKAFENGKNVGATQRLPILNENYTPEEIPLSSLEMLFHNTALYSVQPENHVSYTNVHKWPEIQQRCYDRSVNVTKTYLDYILQFLPKTN